MSIPCQLLYCKLPSIKKLTWLSSSLCKVDESLVELPHSGVPHEGNLNRLLLLLLKFSFEAMAVEISEWKCLLRSEKLTNLVLNHCNTYLYSDIQSVGRFR